MSTAYAFIPMNYLESYKEIKMVAWRWRELEAEGQEYDLLLNFHVHVTLIFF